MRQHESFRNAAGQLALRGKFAKSNLPAKGKLSGGLFNDFATPFHHVHKQDLVAESFYFEHDLPPRRSPT
jgi:hypothetical protein